MKSSGIPDRLSTAFAANGEYNDIANSSTTTSLSDGVATYDVGFPPLTRTAISSGGKPPTGLDTNGILFDITNKLQWGDAGGAIPFDSTFAAAITGYPKGAVLRSSDFKGNWLNTIDANITDPEGTAASSTGWIPLAFTGSSAVTGLSATASTLTCLQAARDVVILSGTLTASIYVYFPAWAKTWTVVNNCTGKYNVICSTVSGTGITVPNGTSYQIRGDGTNLVQDFNFGRYIGKKVFSTSGSYTYTPSDGTRMINVLVTGGGASGGGCEGSSTSETLGGAGGGAGGTAIKKLTISSSLTYSVVVGAGGSAVSGAVAGNAGSLSSFAGTIIGYGGVAAFYLNATTTPGGTGGTATGGDVNTSGGDGYDGQSGSHIFPGHGGPSYWGGGGRAGSGGGADAKAIGSGGGGAYDTGMSGSLYSSGAGKVGIVIIEEYS
ncbi:hypothetical protein [Serratia sp. M24T3]|uniref:glycine-rich domain-containing protein n=1 Tax=Serratia sp. M24T3 TaxID=932213 RepID=UPI00025B9F62|nr:hypothetical protein [Serratia sp. M24T3]EIC83958.1 hypothetical protein SPM24T3_13615 [Serratia sp. M24T3]